MYTHAHTCACACECACACACKHRHCICNWDMHAPANWEGIRKLLNLCMILFPDAVMKSEWKNQYWLHVFVGSDLIKFM